jgi:hypothetical protein
MLRRLFPSMSLTQMATQSYQPCALSIEVRAQIIQQQENLHDENDENECKDLLRIYVSFWHSKP